MLRTADEPPGSRTLSLSEIFGAAVRGWLSMVGVVCLFSGLKLALRRHTYPVTPRMVSDTLSIGLIYFLATGVVLVVTVLLLLWPYFALRQPGTLLVRPWRLYLEPCLLGLGFIAILQATVFRISAELPLLQLVPTGLFAVLTSLCSSCFLHRRLKREALS